MAFGSENVKFKHKETIFCFKTLYIYIYVGLMYFHFKGHL